MTVEGAEAEGEGQPHIGGALLKDSTLYLLGSLLNRLVGFLLIPFYARHLDPAQYGLVELVELSTQTIAIALGLQAVGAALSRMFYDQRTREAEHAVVSTAVLATGLLSAGVTLVAVVFAEPLSELVFHTAQWTRLLQAAFVAMFLGNMIEVVLVHERILNRALFFNVYSTVLLALSLGLNVLLIGFLGAGVWGFVVSKLIVSAVGCTYLLARVHREVGWRWRPAYVPEFVRLGVPLVVSALAYFMIHFSDRFFLTGFVSLADLGRYSLAYKFAMLVSVLTGDAFAKSWEATLFRYTDRAGWRAEFASVASYLTLALFATGLGIALFSPELMRVMVPADYMPPPLVIPIVVLSYVCREIGDFFRTLLLINKRALQVGQVASFGAVVNLGVNALLIPPFGVMGAAYATLATWFAYMVACWVVANREHRLPIRTLAYVRVTLLACGFYLVAVDVRVGGVVLQALADGVWVLAFLAVALGVFLSRGERSELWGLGRQGWAWVSAWRRARGRA